MKASDQMWGDGIFGNLNFEEDDKAAKKVGKKRDLGIK